MKLLSKIIVLLCVCCVNTYAQSPIGSKVYDKLTVKSATLNKEVNYSLYLPADYETSERSYPVLYLLHGYGDDHTAWVQFGQVKAIADKAIDEGSITPMIIVMPNAETSWYINDYKGEFKFEDFFINELIPAIESKYRCRAKKEFRAVAGLSMGGYGSLIYALKYPDMFAACCPLSAAVFTDEEYAAMSGDNSRMKLFGQLYGETKKGEKLPEHWNKNSVLKLITNMSKEQKRAVRFYIDCGDDDFLYKGNAALHVALRDAGVPHEFRMRDGGHTWEYWRTALPQVLEFVSGSFHR